MRRFTVIFLSLMTLLVASCNKKQLETTYDKQETNIQKIIESLKKATSAATRTITREITRSILGNLGK